MAAKTPVSTPIHLASFVEYAEGSIVSRTLVDRKAGTLTLFAFDQGQNLSEHTAPFDAVVQVVDGEALLIIGGEEVRAGAGELVIMPAHVPHAVRAEKRFKMLLVMNPGRMRVRPSGGEPMKRVLGVLGLVAGWAAGAWAYPNGTPHYVTDLVPACASCHSVRDAGTMPELPDRRAQGELAANKHLGAIRAGAFPMYAELTPKQRELLAAEVERIDREARVELRGPDAAAPGDTVEVTVSYRGGNGPVVGVLLADRPLRYQARPAQAAGWRIVGVSARTASGEGAEEWFSHRVDGATDLNFVLLPASPGKGEPPSGTVTFRLRAPAEEGTAPLTAVFLYGTENTDRAGFFQRPSGRILFSAPLEVRVARGN